MRRTPGLFPAFLLPLLALGCTTQSLVRSELGPDRGVLLASGPERTPSGQGVEVRVRLFPGDDETPPRLHVARTRARKVVSLGLSVESIGTEMARSLGRPAWRGVLVVGVDEGSAAQRAGVRPGDILLAIDGTEIVAAEQYRELVAGKKPGLAMTLTILRAPPGDLSGERQRVRISVIPDAHEETETASETVGLSPDREVFDLTGLQVAEIPPTPSLPSELPAGTPIVTGVWVGSPAYEEGFRTGDRLLAVDGAAPAELSTLRARLRAHADSLGLRGVLPGVEPLGGPEPPVLRVEGPAGRWEAPLRVRPDFRKKRSVHVPILFEYEGSAAHTKWSFLNFVFRFGMNYEKFLLPSKERSPRSVLAWSLFPLGMFEYRRTPNGKKITLFWLFHIRTESE